MELSEFAPSARRWSPLAAAAAQRPSVALRLGCAGLVVLLLLVGAAVVYATGGTRQPWLHVLYLPVLVAGWGLGVGGGVAAGVAAGLLVGPLMPLDVAAGEAQPTVNWLYRLGFLTGIGAAAGWLASLLRAQLRTAQQARRRFTALVEHAPDVIVVCDDDGVVRYVSPAARRVLGRPAAELVDRRFAELVQGEDDGALARLLATAPPGKTRGVELRVRHADGSWRHLEVVASDLRADADVGAIVLNARDLTERRAVEAELRHQAAHDAATGLPNRQRVTDALRAVLEASGEHGRQPVAVLLLNLERFRAINETYGPDTGDQLIAALARRLAGHVRPQDILARYGGNEFVLLCPGLTDTAAAAGIAERLLAAVAEPFLLVTGEVRLQASIGVAIVDDDGREPAAVLADAYTALRHAKRQGGNRHALFRPDLGTHTRTALRTEHALHGVVERGELALHYQPIVRLHGSRPASVEALLRWQHPQLGTVAPSDFVPLAEQTGSIHPIGRWVLTEACRQLATWRTDWGQNSLSVAVNLSPVQLDDPQLLAHVEHALASAGIPPAALTLELTETALMHDPDQAIQALIALKGLGVRVAVDDFGTGYSSLGLLHQLPVDVLKIDRLFTRQLGGDQPDDTIVSAVIGLARTLGLDTVAEGVETHGQARALARLGCQYAQGYLYAPPHPAARVTELLSRPAA